MELCDSEHKDVWKNAMSQMHRRQMKRATQMKRAIPDKILEEDETKEITERLKLETSKFYEAFKKISEQKVA